MSHQKLSIANDFSKSKRSEINLGGRITPFLLEKMLNFAKMKNTAHNKWCAVPVHVSQKDTHTLKHATNGVLTISGHGHASAFSAWYLDRGPWHGSKDCQMHLGGSLMLRSTFVLDIVIHPNW
jgi:hypothetical protein